MEEEIIKLELGKIHALKLIDFENEIKKGALVLDMRNALSFENGFIPRSIYFAFHEKTLKIANQLFELDRRIIIVAETGKETEASEGLLKLGYSNIGGYLEHGFSTWKEAGKQIDMIISITAEEFALDLQWSENSKTIDVRTPEEWTSGVVAGTILLPLENLPEKISNLDIKQEYEIYCQDGIRSLIATSFLKMHGFQLTKNLYGGILGLDEEISLVMP